MPMIILSGCDDATYADIDLTTEQEDFLRSLFAQINARSSYGCEPVIYFDGESPA